MAFDIEMIKKVYASIGERVNKAKEVTGKPLTLAEKILYSHLYEGNPSESFKRGESYVDFAPDRIACQDATAQMALLQFMQAGKSKVAVPTTVHCDHLIQAKIGAASDLQSALNSSNEVFNFWNLYQINTGLVSGNLALVSFTRWYWKIMHSLGE